MRVFSLPSERPFYLISLECSLACGSPIAKFGVHMPIILLIHIIHIHVFCFVIGCDVSFA